MIQLRPATEDDFDKVAGLLQQLWPKKESDRRQLQEIFLKVIGQPTCHYICAIKEEEVVGLGSIRIKDSLWQEGTVAHIEELVVHEKRRGIGIGSALLDHLTVLAQRQGCRRIELDSGLHRKDAHEFYERKGMEKRAYCFSRVL